MWPARLRRARRTDSVPAAIETLENRRMLAADPVTIALGLGAAKSVQFTDPAGNQAIVFVAGPGTANVTFNGTGITQAATMRGVVLGGSNVTLGTVTTNGTTSGTILHIDVKGKGTIASGSIVSGGTLGSIHAPNVIVNGDIAMTGGWVHYIQTSGVQGGTITVGSAHLATAALIADLGSVSDVSLTSGVPVQSLAATQWADTTGTHTIQTPKIGTLSIKNNFAPGLTLTAPGKGDELGEFHAAGITGGTWNLAGNAGTIQAGTVAGWTATIGGTVSTINVTHDASANITAGAINTMSVHGTLSGSMISLINPPTAHGTDLGQLSVGGDILTTTIKSFGNIGSINATLVHDSQVYAGIVSLPSGQTLPAQPGDFSNSATIQSVSLRHSASASFANSEIAAYTINNLALGTVQMSNGGTPFGVGAHDLKAISLTDLTTSKSVHIAKVVSTAAFNSALAAKGISQQDFAVTIV